jgi:hypothetical protein
MNVPAFNEIWSEILGEKIIKKHRQYGDSLEDPILVFNGIMNNQLLIDVRLDDKLSRLRQLDNEDPKYWSEIREIVAYLMWKLVLKEEEEREETNNNSGHERNEVESPKDTGKIRRGSVRNFIIRGLPNK